MVKQQQHRSKEKNEYVHVESTYYWEHVYYKTSTETVLKKKINSKLCRMSIEEGSIARRMI